MSSSPHRPTIDALLDQAVEAINRGDRAAASALAEEVLAVDQGNVDAEDLLAAPEDHGEIRRLTILFADVVDSTVLSRQVDPEIYRTVVGRYREQVQRIVEQYEGHIASTKGDGLLAVFGHPMAHENDGQRAVRAGLDITRIVARLDDQARRRFGFGIQARVGVHRGVVYLDTAQDDVYGFGANLASRLAGLAEPGTMVVSKAVERVLRNTFELEERPAKPVRGVEGVVEHFRVAGERDTTRFPKGPLVGRQRERDYLETSWTQAQAGTLTIPGVALRGEAGIGKSRLVSAAADLAESSNATVLSLFGSPFHTDVGLHPVRRLVERRCGISRALYPAERLRRLEAELDERSLDPGTMIPLLAPVLGIAPDSGYQAIQADGRKLHEMIVGAVHDYLLACLGEGPALVLFEDMHWYDEDTIEVVQSLLNEQLHRTLIVMTGRESASLPTSTQAKELNLQPLTEDEADELTLALHPEATLEGRLAVRRRCDGVPLYIEEVVAKLKEQPSDSSESALVPDTLYEALFARLRSNSGSGRIVEAAAIIGGRIDRSLLLSAVELDEDEVDQVIGELTDARVLEPIGRDSWRFRHELLREVAAELSPPSLRHSLHGRIADALVAGATDGNPDWPVVAGHYERAERYVEAAGCYQQAAANARRRGALAEARTYLTNGISQIERSTPGPERDRGEIALRLRRGSFVSAAEGVSSPNAAADFERCLELSENHLHEDEFFSTLIALYGYYAMRVDLHRVDQLLESVRVTLTGRREWFRPFNDAGFGMVAWYRGQFDSALAQLEAAALVRSDEGARDLESVWYMPNEATASIYTHLVLARYIKGDLTGAEADAARTERRCEQSDFPQGPFSLAYLRQMETLMRIESGELELAAAAATDLARLGEQYGFDSWAMVGAAQQVTVAAVSSLAAQADPAELQTHIATLTMFVDTWRALGVICLITYYDAVIARLLIAAGQVAEARDRIHIGLQLGEDTGMRFHEAELLRIRAFTREDDEQRSADLRAAIQLAREQGATVYELRAAADDFELRGEPARQALTDAISRFPEGSTWPPLERARALLG